MRQSLETYIQDVRSRIVRRNYKHQLNEYGVSVVELLEYYEARIHPGKAADRICSRWGYRKR